MFKLSRKQYAKEKRNYRKTYIGKQLLFSKIIMEILFFVFIAFAVFECVQFGDEMIMNVAVNDIFFLAIDLVCLIGIIVAILRNEGIDFEMLNKYIEEKNN
ncbi:MAG: hypothetical protein IKO49_03295 [Bacilli bacterium]|nr:hypothetical protein [Bacilli bacterium]